MTELPILPLKPTQSKNDRWSDLEHMISHPFTMCIHAPSRSGKSVVLTNFLYKSLSNIDDSSTIINE